MHRPQIAILASGEGTTAEAFIRTGASGAIAAQVGLVICNNPKAGIFKRIEALNQELGLAIKCVLIGRSNYPPEQNEQLGLGSQTRAEEAEIRRILLAGNFDLICLMGYLKKVGPNLVKQFGGLSTHTSPYQAMMLNTHPGLLPDTVGLWGRNAQEFVLKHKYTHAGQTLIVVADEYDTGTVIAEHKITVQPNDTPDSLFERVQTIEKQYLPSDIDRFIQKRQKYLSDRGQLDLREIARSQGESARAKTVLSEREVPEGTSREEKLFTTEISRSGDEGISRQSTQHARVLIIGGGGREHALAWKMAESPRVDQIYVAPGNGGTEAIAQNVPINFTDVKALVKFAQDNQIDLTVVGQEAASAAGVVDAFNAAGLTIFGPTLAATAIESSKAFSKDLMREQDIPTATFATFTNPNLATEYIQDKKFPLVIKASGLAEGKGVVIAPDLATAKNAIQDMMVKKSFKDAGDIIVIEEFLQGQEVSIHALCDGKNAVLFPASQDHKQVFDDDKGPNTGGMGVVAPLPWVTDEHLDFAMEHVVIPALASLQAKNTPFTGCLYPGLMIDDNDIKVLEFNARFGDPEAETYLRLLDSDLYEILHACAQGKLDPSQVKWKQATAISVAIASDGYPGSYAKGLPITGVDVAENIEDVVVFHAGTTMSDNDLLTNGGRVLFVTALGNSIEDARTKAYQAIKLIHFEGMHYRTDIGKRPAGVTN